MGRFKECVVITTSKDEPARLIHGGIVAWEEEFISRARQQQIADNGEKIWRVRMEFLEVLEPSKDETMNLTSLVGRDPG